MTDMQTDGQTGGFAVALYAVARKTFRLSHLCILVLVHLLVKVVIFILNLCYAKK